MSPDPVRLYTDMLRMRRIEETACALYHRADSPITGRIYTGRGQEAISVGATHALREDDALAPLYRDLGAHLVRGISAEAVFAQYMGRVGSACEGRDSGLHIGDPGKRLISMISNLAASMPAAVGQALASHIEGADRVALTFVGDGATAHGSFHESVNMAGALKLPVIIIIENNQWALSTPVQHHTALDRLADRAAGHGVPGIQVDGNDVEAVYAATVEAVERARRGEGPTIIEAVTFRMEGHSVTDPAHYVPDDLRAEWAERDPLDRLVKRHPEALTEAACARIEAEVQAEISEAARRAEARPEVPGEAATERVFAAPSPDGVEDPTAHKGPELTYRSAIRQALEEAMAADPRVFILGEDIRYGGVYGITRGFLDRFGPDRLIDTPIAEAAIVGAATGAALEGLRPVAEIQFADFIAPAMDLLVNLTATYHYRTGHAVPLVLRAPAGAIIERAHGSTGPFHSQSPEAWFAHTPGLKVVIPATPADARGLLLSALADPDPVIFLEQKALYNAKGPVPEPGGPAVPLGRLRVARSGDDITLITWGAMVPLALEAAAEVARDAQSSALSVEVLDLRTLIPLDREGLLASVRRTGRALIVHEATQTAGFGAEIAALIADEAFDWLDAPVRRVCAPDAPTPSAWALASAWRPDVDNLTTALRRLGRE